MRIYEIFRKTKETYIFIKINIDCFSEYIININLYFLKHLIEQFIFNSFFKIKILCLNDSYIDNHHLIEDLGITIGKVFNKILNKNININRYSFYFVILDDCLSRTLIDISGRSYLKLNIFYNNYYINNLNIDLLYDFFLSFVNNFKISLHILNSYGNNLHHKFETIFKSLGRSLKIALKINYNKNILLSTKGFI